MPIKTRNVPDEVIDAFRRGIESLDDRDVPNKAELRNASVQGVPIFALTLADISTGKLSEARSGWILAPAGKTTLVEIATGGAISGTRFAGITRAPWAARFFEQLELILSGQITNETGFELRFLRIPGVQVSAFWLASPGGTLDTVVPIRGPGALTKGKQYKLRDFLVILQPLVEKFLKFDRA